jgi:formate dehydrogenase maturation protein FdhE
MDPEAPLVCPACASPKVKFATDAIYVVYLRCDACATVWSVPKDEWQQRQRGDGEGRKKA